jgi:hypothetical protein
MDIKKKLELIELSEDFEITEVGAWVYEVTEKNSGVEANIYLKPGDIVVEYNQKSGYENFNSHDFFRLNNFIKLLLREG